MLMRKKKPSLNNEKGMAIFEMIPILFVIILLFNFSLGFFGAIHTGIVNSIGARNNAFATFNHRANLVYFRNVTPASASYSPAEIHYEQKGCRIHAVADYGSGSPDFLATKRYLNYFDTTSIALDEASKSQHNTDVNAITDSSRNEKTSVNPIWIKTSYGICLNAKCTGPS
ncbi:MAG TPA: hypothetical protein VF412_11120 [Bdellovibrio sp.]|uniref:hypothetical protein n=1 Tax=Bdellovibrio sp. TaxID=28201 RepID=UPI002EE609D4